MDTSKQLITALKNSDSLDRLLITCALVFFILVVLFILKQRVLDRSIRLALWWTRFLPNLSSDTQLTQMEQGDLASSLLVATGTITTTVSSIVATASSTPISTVLAPLSSEPFESHVNVSSHDGLSSDASTLITEPDPMSHSTARTTSSESEQTHSTNVHEEL
jgi:protein transport protein SEC20